MSKNLLSFLLRILFLLLLAAGALWGAMVLMDSLMAFRSPLHTHPPEPGAALLEKGMPAITRRVVFVLVDALRVDTAEKASVMPFLAELRPRGAWATMRSRPPSYSQPGYTVLLTGAWPELSDGHAINADYNEIRTFTQDDLFSAVHRAGMKTAIAAYYWFEKLLPQAAVDFGFYTPDDNAEADRQVLAAALPWLKNKQAQLILIHFDQVDYAGHHEGGPRNPRWDAAARQVDDMLRQVANELDFTRDTLLVVSDHGQIDAGGHGGHEEVVLREPFLLVGAGVKPGNFAEINMVDVAPTLAALLGANLPASSQGEVRLEMLDLPAPVQAALPEALRRQQAQLLEIYLEQIKRQAPVAPGENVVVSHQAALERAREQRLWSERLLRLPLALVVIVLLVTWFLRKPKRQTLWMLGAGVLYMLGFNLVYAVIEGRTYSLSSLSSQNDLLINTALLSSLSIAIAWLVYFLGQQHYRQAPARAISLNLDMLLGVIFVLVIPYLVSYFWNGARVTWTLPDFATSFVGFFSLLQVLMVAVVGILLAGLSGLIARLARSKITASD